MPLESATFIDGLNSSNPVGSTDKVQTLDDHIRLIKSTILASFPGITGAVTPTHTELNFVDGVTSAIQTQLDTKAAAAALNASNLTSGTVPDARFPATLPAASGVNLTALNGTNIASGTVADARLSSNVPLKNGTNIFSAPQSLTDSQGLSVGTGLDLTLYHNGTTSVIRNDTGSLIVQSASTHDALEITSAGNFDFKDGTVTTANSSASEVGFKGVPGTTQGDGYTLALSDCGKYISPTGTGFTWTIPPNGTVAFPQDSVINIINNSGGALTIARGAGVVLLLAGSGADANRTLSGSTGIATLIKLATNIWAITGPGVS